MKAKVIRVGNSAAVTIPKNVLEERNIKIGDEAEVAVKSLKKESAVPSEFLEWLNQYIDKNRAALEELAEKVRTYK
jgi:antitoxin component of MazEF toxin-antitoxin module